MKIVSTKYLDKSTLDEVGAWGWEEPREERFLKVEMHTAAEAVRREKNRLRQKRYRQRLQQRLQQEVEVSKLTGPSVRSS